MYTVYLKYVSDRHPGQTPARNFMISRMHLLMTLVDETRSGHFCPGFKIAADSWGLRFTFCPKILLAPHQFVTDSEGRLPAEAPPKPLPAMPGFLWKSLEWMIKKK